MYICMCSAVKQDELINLMEEGCSFSSACTKLEIGMDCQTCLEGLEDAIKEKIKKA